MKKVLSLIAMALTVSAAIFSLSPAATAAFIPNPGPAQPGPSQPPQQPPQTPPQPVSPPPAPQYQPSLDGTWQAITPNNSVGYMLIAGNQYQLWLNNQMIESGTLTIQGNTLYQQPNGGQASADNFQLSPDGMTLTVFGAQGSTTFQKVQQTTPSQPSQPAPQPMPSPQPPTYPQPGYPQQPQPGYPQPAPPQQNLQAQLQGSWSAYWGGLQTTFIFSGNQFSASAYNQALDYGTYTVQGNVVYYNSTTGILNQPVMIQMAPDGRSFVASDTRGANGLVWTRVQ